MKTLYFIKKMKVISLIFVLLIVGLFVFNGNLKNDGTAFAAEDSNTVEIYKLDKKTGEKVKVEIQEKDMTNEKSSDEKESSEDETQSDQDQY